MTADPAVPRENMRARLADHGPYLAAVARALDAAGFTLEPPKILTAPCRWGGMVLHVMDDWDDLRSRYAALRWSEAEVRLSSRFRPKGWSVRVGGLTEALPLAVLAAPSQVANALAWEVGSSAHADLDGLPDVGAEPGSAEFETALASYAQVAA